MNKKKRIKWFMFLFATSILLNSNIALASETTLSENVLQETPVPKVIIEEQVPTPTPEIIVEEQKPLDETTIVENAINSTQAIEPTIPKTTIAPTIQATQPDVILYEYSNEIAQGEIISESLGVDGTKTTTYSLGKNLEEQLALDSLKTLTATGLNATFTNVGITIDGNFDDWSDKPISYEYNWDNSSSCWYWGEWYKGVKYTTPEGTYDNNVRHAMQLACDGEYVYLHIKFATIYQSKFNGEDYRFYFDGIETAFQITDLKGKTITNNINKYKVDSYPILVRHRASALSWSVVDGSDGYIQTYKNNENADLEIKIPLSEFKRQNPSVNIEKINEIQYFCPNLMYRRISSYGSNTGIIIGVLFSISIVSFSLYKTKNRKNNKQCKKKDTNSLIE